jgi:hypothetical protein
MNSLTNNQVNELHTKYKILVSELYDVIAKQDRYISIITDGADNSLGLSYSEYIKYNNLLQLSYQNETDFRNQINHLDTMLNTQFDNQSLNKCTLQ